MISHIFSYNKHILTLFQGKKASTLTIACKRMRVYYALRIIMLPNCAIDLSPRSAFTYVHVAEIIGGSGGVKSGL